MKEFFDTFGLGKPVVLKHEYIKFRWVETEVDCTEFLEKFGGTVEDLNNKIQGLKKSKGCDFEQVDAVNTELGNVSKAYIKYPVISDKELLKLLCIYSQWVGLGVYENIEELRENVLNGLIKLKNSYDREMGFDRQVRKVFEDLTNYDWLHSLNEEELGYWLAHDECELCCVHGNEHCEGSWECCTNGIASWLKQQKG